ncbi:Acireductone dioxygenase ARD family [Lipomyces tetrasporus]|uniref:Acireductone dioxygenase n=1 Tax=Lipomyces tetrasporus TaxID=54092 RepID=A0AAD7QUV3_9ASCO|nr:Acireductone dioxygenase ARD family [Lipomyces tetrasporus]KAJ8101421.1 Acireductone dioxygenase ARD family [Lipomyces tetrasporus]
MKVYYHDNTAEDQRLDHDSGIEVPAEAVANLGVLAYNFTGPSALDNVDALALSRDYKNRDVITISPVSMGDVYEEKVKTFYKEHLHEDEEIRYIVEGEGFFDVRDGQDRWVRLKMDAGDLIILPAGIYHRFSTTSTNYIKAMRLFKDEPKWTPLPRPCDDNQYRVEYLQSIKAN